MTIPDEAIPDDRRLLLWRPDLADDRLRHLPAAHYIVPILHRCTAATTPVQRDPDTEAEAVSALLCGEVFHVLESKGDWCWGQCAHDGYVGYVAAAHLRPGGDRPTHRVVAAAAHIFSAPSIKSAPNGWLPMGARVFTMPDDPPFVYFAAGVNMGRVHARALAPLDAFAEDYVAVAARLVGSPYLWGGRTRAGLDCSGLVQVALAEAGIAAPRDSDQQQALGVAVDPAGDLQRGDLVFLPGHVGIMTDARTLLHANAWWMTTLAEPLVDVLARQAAAGRPGVIAVRRLRPA